MYSTCLFCHQSLESNESIEHFPIGRRLAFDSAKGRLWVICSHCLRWNLTPLEERWEAIEECERLFRGQPLRAQTDEIGLTKLREGLQLIRIGAPLRPEFASWRYGNAFSARLRKTAAWAGGAVAAAGAGIAIGVATGVVEVAWPLMMQAIYVGGAVFYRRVKGRQYVMRPIHVPSEHDRPYTLFNENIQETDLAPGKLPGEWTVKLRHALGSVPLTGHTARRALGVLMTRINAAGALSGTTRKAAEHIAATGGPEAFMAKLADMSHLRAGNFEEQRAHFRRYGSAPGVDGFAPPVNLGALPRFDVEHRLAIEMAVHEEDEQRVLEGELAPLEAAWRNAEEIAAIADNLLTSPEAEQFIRRHRAKKQR